MNAPGFLRRGTKRAPVRRGLRLEFRGIAALGAKTVGPAGRFQIAGNFIRSQPGAKVVAQYFRYQWHVQGEHFSRFDCRSPAKIYFTDADGTRSPSFGPFNHIFVADGTLYADDQIFAKFVDETLLWHSFELETHWPKLILQAAR